MGSLVTPLRKIHPTAVVDPGAVIGKNVEIGPYAIIESDVVLGDGCVVMPHAVIYKYTTVGKDCRFFPGLRRRRRTPGFKVCRRENLDGDR
jgi:UDP-N-acetylglucosamine acyltransferase